MSTHRASTVLPLIVLVAAALVLMAVDRPLRRATTQAQMLASAELTPFELERRNQSAFARMLGDFRASAADVMFVKTERYLHGGMSWAPHLDASQMAASGVVVDKSVNINSEILPREIDFRGPLGDLERAVKPYDLKHRHTDTDELLPWYRLMTVMDPHYVRGYRIGAYWLIARPDADSWREAALFLDEGLAKNNGAPEEFRIWVTRSLYYQKRLQRAEKTPEFLGDNPQQLLEEALHSARKAFELGLAQRPADGKIGSFGPNLLWTDDMEDDFRFGARYVPSFLREMGRRDEAMASVIEMRKLVPDDKPLRNLQWSMEAEIRKEAEAAASGS